MLIDWSNSADFDLMEILAFFISNEQESIGRDIVSRIIKSSNILKTQPFAGKLGRIDGTRELVVRKLPYIIVYQIISARALEIVRIIHTSRLFPESLFKEDNE